MFSQLMRKSRLLTVETASACKQNYLLAEDATSGLKRTVPIQSLNPIFKVDALDTEYCDARLSNGSVDALRYYSAVENFASFTSRGSKAAERETEAARRNVSDMSKEEFQQLLTKAKEKRAEFDKLVGTQKISRQDPALIEQVLGVRISQDEAEHMYPYSVHYLHYDKKVGPPLVSDGTKETVQNQRVKAKMVLVKGRVFNRVPKGYAVGIGGIVAFLPMESMNLFRQTLRFDNPTKVHDFYVRHFKLDAEGRPDMVVSLEPTAYNDSVEEADLQESNDAMHDEARISALLADLCDKTSLAASSYATKRGPPSRRNERQRSGRRDTVKFDFDSLLSELSSPSLPKSPGGEKK